RAAECVKRGVGGEYEYEVVEFRMLIGLAREAAPSPPAPLPRRTGGEWSGDLKDHGLNSAYKPHDLRTGERGEGSGECELAAAAQGLAAGVAASTAAKSPAIEATRR